LLNKSYKGRKRKRGLRLTVRLQWNQKHKQSRNTKRSLKITIGTTVERESVQKK